MIECESCGEYWKPDDIESCPNPNCEYGYDDLCPRCHENHVTSCMLGEG